jgi:fermentation-respiration switch protein FrsA (DUF1100 family)
MTERHIRFYSEGHKLDGALYLPDNYQPGQKLPAIIPNSGYQGVHEFYPKLFSKYLTAAGYACLGFDYRGFAKSEGRQGRVILAEQVEDIKNAVTFLRTQDEVDPEAIGLIGWGMGAFNVVQLAAADKRVKAVAALNGFYNGERWLKSIHSYVEWVELLKSIEEDRIRRVTTGRSKPSDPFIHYPLDPTTKRYVQKDLQPLNPLSAKIDMQFTDSILGMNAEQTAAAISPRPLFIGHGWDNMLHPREEAEALYKAAAEPKELYWVDGQHNDFMHYDDPQMNKLMGRLTEFFEVLRSRQVVEYTA